MCPIFVFANVVGQFTPKWSGLTSMRTANRENHSTKLCSFTSSSCTCPASSASIQSVMRFKFFKRTGSLTQGLTNNRFSHYHLRTPDLNQQQVRCIKEIPRTGSCEPVECHHCIKCIFSTYGLVWFNIRNSLDVVKAEKLIKIYRFYRAEEDNQQTLLKLFKFFFSLFHVLQISLLFVWIH